MKKIKLILIFLLASIVSIGQTYFAEVIDDTVARVIVADQTFVNSGAVGSPASWIETDYFTHGGVHSGGGTPLRKNYASIGDTYDLSRDAFYSPQIHPSAYLDESTCYWEFYDLPVLGTWIEMGTAWKFDDNGEDIIVEVVQSHNRTSHNPRIIPALFRILQFGNELEWIAGEAVIIDDSRKHIGVHYRCIQAHTTQVGWEPPNVPALWEVVAGWSSIWTVGVPYAVNDEIIYAPSGLSYKCLQAHTAQVGWEPPNVPALWQLIP